MGSQWTNDGQMKTKSLFFRPHWKWEIEWEDPNMGDIVIYASKINVVSQSKKELQAQKMLEKTTKFTGEQYEVGVLWSEPERNLPKNYS